MNLAFDLLFSEEDQNHSLGENTEECLIEIDLRPSRGGTKKYFVCSTAYIVPRRRLAGRERKCKWLICGGSCSGRTYGPLIKCSEQSKSEQTQHDLTPQQTEDSKKSSS
jgi:hypothetical protein